jgi:hypothetical protein
MRARWTITSRSTRTGGSPWPWAGAPTGYGEAFARAIRYDPMDGPSKDANEAEKRRIVEGHIELFGAMRTPPE